MQPQPVAYPQGNLQDLEKCRQNFPRQTEADWKVWLHRARAGGFECLMVPRWLDGRALTMGMEAHATEVTSLVERKKDVY